MDSTTLIKLLEANGWRLKRINGSHHVFSNPENIRNISVPHPRKDIAKGTLQGILKKANLKI